MLPDTSSAVEPAGATPGPHGGAPAAEERALLEAVLQKDRKAAAEFVSRFADPVFGYVSRRLTPRADLVEDVVQDVFLVALQKLDTFAGQSSVVGWLLGIARHKVEDVYRARLREPDPFPDDMDGLSAGAAIEPDLDEVIDAARAEEKTRRILDQLPSAYSAVLQWRYWEKRSAREMAEQTGQTEKAIERLLARARMYFKRLWEAD
ncbi:MAG: sigma-70 family RNA polymerase sigma factor [Vicinamibacterales bacterium]